MPFPMDLSHCLAFAPAYEPLNVTRVPEQALRTLAPSQQLSEGDRVCRVAERDGHVLLEKENGERVLLNSMQALFIEVDVADRRTPGEHR